jgi:hypothetical protein
MYIKDWFKPIFRVFQSSLHSKLKCPITTKSFAPSTVHATSQVTILCLCVFRRWYCAIRGSPVKRRLTSHPLKSSCRNAGYRMGNWLAPVLSWSSLSVAGAAFVPGNALQSSRCTSHWPRSLSSAICLFILTFDSFRHSQNPCNPLQIRAYF